MKITITRKTFTDQSTIGEISLDGMFQCYTLEDVVRDGEKVFGKTAIPAGDYEMIINQSAKFKKELPLIYNRPDFTVSDNSGNSWSGIRIHSGNNATDTDGCILVGALKSENEIGNSRIAFYRLMAKIESMKFPMSLTIINNSSPLAGTFI